jgi:hypothetical protein
MNDSADLIHRLREQAQAGGFRWVDVMRLLLEAAQALEDADRECRQFSDMGRWRKLVD